MNWWPFGKETVAKDGPQALLDEIEKRGKQYVDDVDNGKLISPACKRTTSDAGHDQAAIADHTRLEAFRYLLAVPRSEFRLLADPDQQAALLDGYLRQLPHEDMVIEFTGVTQADLAIAIIAGFNWLVHCAVLAGANPNQFYGTLRNFRRVASTAQKWWAADGAKERYAEMLQAQQEPPLFLNLVWTDYGRMAEEIATAHAAHPPTGASQKGPPRDGP
jgi:hypothetical protein